MLRERDLGTLHEPDRSSLDDYLDEWLEIVAGPRLRVRSLDIYRSILANHIRPTLGRLLLSRLKPSHIQRVYAAMPERGLAASTIKITHSVLRSALEQAVKWGRIRSNPADLVDLPRGARREMLALTAEESQRYLAAARSDERGSLLILLLATGLRPAEALGLRWPDIDLTTGEAQVRRTIVRPRGGSWQFGEPKTAKSSRRITIPAGALEVLLTHQLEAVYSPHDLVFCTIDGEPLNVSNLSRRNHKAVLSVAGLPKEVRLYDLRHTCATLLLLAGVHPKVVSERLGHSSIRETLDTYSHVLPSMQEQAAEALDELLFKRVGEGERDPAKLVN
jgi:integrase